MSVFVLRITAAISARWTPATFGTLIHVARVVLTILFFLAALLSVARFIIIEITTFTFGRCAGT